MTIKIYGPTASRAARALWIVHELGIPFEHVAMEMKDLKGADYLKINPNGKVPTLVDGDFKLFESMAINLYLAAKHGKDGFFPASLEDQALCHQWSFWGMTEVEKPLLTVLIDMFMTAPDKRKPEAVAEAQKALPKPFGVLNGALQGREYLLGSTFTVADLNLASICSWAKPIKFDFGPFPNAGAWLDRCLARPAYKAARSDQVEERYSAGCRLRRGAASSCAVAARQQQRHQGDHDGDARQAEEQQFQAAGGLAHPGDQQDGDRAGAQRHDELRAEAQAVIAAGRVARDQDVLDRTRRRAQHRRGDGAQQRHVAVAHGQRQHGGDLQRRGR